MKRVKMKLDAIEAMLYFWQATNDREKVGEAYLNNLAGLPEMQYMYDNEFNPESIRKTLSAISNREPFQSSVKKERVFWNNNMWMMEDLEYTNMMVTPLKVLNLDAMIETINEKAKASKYEEIEVLFVPGHQFEYLIIENKLIINFFRVKPDLYEENKVTIGDTLLLDFIEEKLIELINQ
ncbi:MAG: hypothetical protein JJT76_15985 [Clostridiaceae bacterium]|nr:hypothetical protein [Clostridiaceae bacterium]